MLSLTLSNCPLSLPDALPIFTAELDPSRAAFVPRGVGNAFQTLAPGTAYSYLVNDHWSPEASYSLLNPADPTRSEEHTSALQSRGHLVCRLLLEKQDKQILHY